MANKITVVSAVVKDTGWPIDGHRLYFKDLGALAEEWPLYAWKDEDAEAVKLTFWAWLVETGNTTIRTFDEFTEAFDAKRPVTDTIFTVKASCLEDKKTEGEIDAPEEPEITIEPRKETDRGGIMLLPMKKNIGDVSESHPDWKLISCPKCGQECYEYPETQRLILTQGVTAMCTECAIKEGLVRAYTRKNMPHPDGNRATRRAKKKAGRKKP